MKALLLLSVLLSGVLAITAAAVEAPEAVKVVEAPEPVEAAEAVEAAPQELQEIDHNEDPEMVSTGEITSAAEGRFYTCPTGWEKYKNACYRVETSSRHWRDAASYCSGQGATLASAHNGFEYDFLQQLTAKAGQIHSWLGGFYREAWWWPDLSPITWNAHYTSSSYPCLYLRSAGSWSNSQCNVGRPFICKMKIENC